MNAANQMLTSPQLGIAANQMRGFDEGGGQLRECLVDMECRTFSLSWACREANAMDGIVRAVHQQSGSQAKTAVADSRSTCNCSARKAAARSCRQSRRPTTARPLAGASTSAVGRAAAQSLGVDGCCWVNSANEFEALVGHRDLLDGHASKKREGTCTVHTL